MNEKRFTWKTEKLQHLNDEVIMVVDNENKDWKGHILNIVDKLNKLAEENEQLKKELKRCKDWINSDKYDYELTLSFIKNKGYSLKDVLEYEKELENE